MSHIHPHLVFFHLISGNYLQLHNTSQATILPKFIYSSKLHVFPILKRHFTVYHYSNHLIQLKLYLTTVKTMAAIKQVYQVPVCVSSLALVCPTLRSQGLQPARLLCPWDFPGTNTGAGCHFLLQGIFTKQGLNPYLRHCRQILYH